MALKKVDYILVGGGSGGHLTPLIPIAQSLHNIDKSFVVVHVGHKNDPLNSVTRESTEIEAVYEVSAGKLRRYHGESWISRVLDIKTNLLNIRDVFRFGIGIVEAWLLLGKLRPKAIMMKGGYVCASVGIAAKFRRIPYMTHDSDAMVSLAHKIIGKSAAKHATAMPPEYYKSYQQEKTTQVGVPIKPIFRPVSVSDQRKAKKKLSIPDDTPVVLVTGGGLGAQNINNAILDSIEVILNKNTYLIHITGGKLQDEVTQSYKSLPESLRSRVLVEGFTSIMHEYSAAADVIVTRASATALTEFAAQSKACIIVPNPLLSGGHQLRNAQALEASNAVKTVNENALTQLAPSIRELLGDATERKRLGTALHKAAMPGAADRIADMLIEISRL